MFYRKVIFQISIYTRLYNLVMTSTHFWSQMGVSMKPGPSPYRRRETAYGRTSINLGLLLCEMGINALPPAELAREG